jgi:hypothetical protein
MPRPSRRGFFVPVEPDFPNVIRLLFDYLEAKPCRHARKPIATL